MPRKPQKRPPLSPLPARPSEPFPDFPHPTPDQCTAVRDDLLAFHGFPEDFAAYRDKRLRKLHQGDPPPPTGPSAPAEGDGEGGVTEEDEEEETVLDGLVSTLLSQNTTESNSRRAFRSLKSAFPSWEDVLAAEPKHVENAIRCGGLAPTKAGRIRSILRVLMDKRGVLCLEYLRGLPAEEVKAELSRFKGIGPKTVACVLMFNLQQDDLPVDTHVLRITKSIGWVPIKADREKAYLHLNRRIPDELKFDLNCLLFTHGKICQLCARKGGNHQPPQASHASCPLASYCCSTGAKC